MRASCDKNLDKFNPHPWAMAIFVLMQAMLPLDFPYFLRLGMYSFITTDERLQ